MERISNDHESLTPDTGIHGRTLELDFPALHIGVARYAEGPTGCTVLHFPAGAAMAVDQRGGSVGFIGDYGFVHAICLAGGSLYGLEAASGVAAELFARRGYATGFMEIALVSGGIIYDYPRRSNAIYPDKALGRAALQAAHPGVFPLGAAGAGCAAGVGAGLDRDRREPGGQGGAFRQVGATRVAVFTVVNAVGAIHDRAGRVVAGQLDVLTGTRESLAADLERRLAAGASAQVKPGNTTLTVVVTNQQLDSRSLTQMGRQVHTSMARAIQPFHTTDDGDVLWAVSTNEVANPALITTALGIVASELAWDAVLSAVGV